MKNKSIFFSITITLTLFVTIFLVSNKNKISLVPNNIANISNTNIINNDFYDRYCVDSIMRIDTGNKLNITSKVNDRRQYEFKELNYSEYLIHLSKQPYISIDKMYIT